ncbi:glycosyl hydrolase family 28-related protein [Paenibacillus hodogayensis]|uniref:Glycosyl hydrolase family 28-related protein n=1 Tax=Paenibacillus hodogayensis TaxID=279208 RepID=A0ABV5VUE8_9BACL
MVNHGDDKRDGDKESEQHEGAGSALISRRSILAQLGMTGAAMAIGGVLGGTIGSARGAEAMSVTGQVYGCGLPEDDLKCVLSVSLAELRSVSAPQADRIYYVSDNGAAGPFVYNPSDTASDNTGTVIVSASGARFRRLFTGPLNVRWFGAKGDGSNNDGPAIQAAIDAAGPRSSVYFPQGTYRITESLWIRQPEVTLFSDFKAEYTPKLSCTVPGTWMIRVKHYSFCMKGIQLEGDGVITQNPYIPTVNGILIDRSDGTGAETLSNLDSDIQFCGFFKLNECVRCVGRNVFFNYNIFNCSVKGVTVEQYPNAECRGYRFVDSRFHSMGLGSFTLAPGVESWCIEFTSILAFGNQVIGNMSDFGKGFYKGPVDRCTINDNQIYSCNGDGIRIVNTEGGTTAYQQGYEICNNIIVAAPNLGWSKSVSDATPQMNYGIVAEGGVLQNGFITGNVVSFPKKDGLRFANLGQSVIESNLILSPNKRADIDGSLYSGITIEAGTQNLVSGNMIRTTVPNGAAHKHGIFNAATSSKLIDNFGFNQSGDFIANTAPDTTDVVEAGIPRYTETYKRDKAIGSFGMRMYTHNAASQKTLFAEMVAVQRSSTAGAEKADIQFNAMSGGAFKPLMIASWQGSLTVGDRTGLETAQNGYVNAKALNGELVSFIASTVASVPNLTLFVDAADNKLKFKNAAGVVTVLA